jgi:hypothetical protein
VNTGASCPPHPVPPAAVLNPIDSMKPWRGAAAKEMMPGTVRPGRVYSRTKGDFLLLSQTVNHRRSPYAGARAYPVRDRPSEADTAAARNARPVLSIGLPPVLPFEGCIPAGDRLDGYEYNRFYRTGHIAPGSMSIPEQSCDPDSHHRDTEIPHVAASIS